MTTAADALIVNTLRDLFPGLCAVYRYGSSGGEYERADSDMDVAVMADRMLDFSALLSATSELARLTGKEIDLNDMRRLPVTLRVQVVTRGMRLFAADPSAAEEYDSRVLSEYAYLNEARKGILEDVRARGSIYG